MLWSWFITAAFAVNPTNGIQLKSVQPIEIEQSFQYSWAAEKPPITQATILVLQVDGDKTGLPQVGAPVLYVGPVPAARINPGSVDQHIVVFVPGHPDLTQTSVFWGPDDLPERVTTQRGTEIEATSTIPPFAASTVSTTTQPTLQVVNQSELYGHIATLIERFAPGDNAFSHSIRVALGQ